MIRFLLSSFLIHVFFNSIPTVAQEIEQGDQNEFQMQQSEDQNEDDSYLQWLLYCKKNPLPLNQATESELSEFAFLSPLQINHFCKYRQLAGKLISIYELQAIPLWDLETIQKIIPYVQLGNSVDFVQDWRDRIQKGAYEFLIRNSFKVGKNTEYRNPDLYPGGREQVLLRLQYQTGNLFQWGFTAEKDAGEQWFKGAQRKGFDFYSGHVFARKIGLIKTLAIGDYTLNIGQGLIHWQSLAFKKSPEVLQIKRQADILRPYHSSGEFFFQRGFGVLLGRNHWQTCFFYSSRKMDGNIQIDSATGNTYVTGLKTSGLHRSISEQLQKGQWKLRSYGVSVRYGSAGRMMGLNAVNYELSREMVRPEYLYHRFSFNGKQYFNCSADWGWSFRNLHWFGEIAVHQMKAAAFLSGLLVSLDPKVSASLVYRDLSNSYYTFFGNAFTESSAPYGEKGIFAGLTIKPAAVWKIDVFADVFRFPWLRYRVDAPSSGSEFLLQVLFKPDRRFELSSRFRKEEKSINQAVEEGLCYTVPSERMSWRTQMQIKLNSAFIWRSRLEVLWLRAGKSLPENGTLIFADLLYRPMMKPFSAGFRWQYSQSDTYNSRIYAYENDVLYRFSIPAFYGKIRRYYVNLEYKWTERCAFWVRWSQTFSDSAEDNSSEKAFFSFGKRDLHLQAVISF
jgi:hypothetical protein